MTRRKSTDGKSYAGLDVSLRETAVCVLNEQGTIIFEGMIATDPDLIADCLAKTSARLGPGWLGSRSHLGLALARAASA
jgi:hypothetical protein